MGSDDAIVVVDEDAVEESSDVCVVDVNNEVVSRRLCIILVPDSDRKDLHREAMEATHNRSRSEEEGCDRRTDDQEFTASFCCCIRRLLFLSIAAPATRLYFDILIFIATSLFASGG